MKNLLCMYTYGKKMFCPENYFFNFWGFFSRQSLVGADLLDTDESCAFIDLRVVSSSLLINFAHQLSLTKKKIPLCGHRLQNLGFPLFKKKKNQLSLIHRVRRINIPAADLLPLHTFPVPASHLYHPQNWSPRLSRCEPPPCGQTGLCVCTAVFTGRLLSPVELSSMARDVNTSTPPVIPDHSPNRPGSANRATSCTACLSQNTKHRWCKN